MLDKSKWAACCENEDGAGVVDAPFPPRCAGLFSPGLSANHMGGQGGTNGPTADEWEGLIFHYHVAHILRIFKPVNSNY